MELAPVGVRARTGHLRSTRRYGLLNLAGPRSSRGACIRMSRPGRIQGHSVCWISGSTAKGNCLFLDIEISAERTGVDVQASANAATVAHRLGRLAQRAPRA